MMEVYLFHLEHMLDKDSSEIRFLKENDDLSDFVPVELNDEFKKKYKGLFSFNGKNSACMIFEQHH